jgi:P-type Cu2+ transporter
MDHDDHHRRAQHRSEAAIRPSAEEHAGHDMGAGGHDRHAGHSVAMFRDKFWLSLALTIPVVLLSHDIRRVVPAA